MASWAKKERERERERERTTGCLAMVLFITAHPSIGHCERWPINVTNGARLPIAKQTTRPNHRQHRQLSLWIDSLISRVNSSFIYLFIYLLLLLLFILNYTQKAVRRLNNNKKNWSSHTCTHFNLNWFSWLLKLFYLAIYLSIFISFYLCIIYLL